MKTITALILVATACLISTVDASIFLTKMTNYLNDPSMDTLKALGIWQLGGVLFPLIAGPLRVVAYVLWTMGAGKEYPEDEML